MLSREYINFLESLPCNRHARRRSRPVGEWLNGWVPEQHQKDFCEPMQQAFVDKDCPDGAFSKLSSS
jgi:hypothetical protein